MLSLDVFENHILVGYENGTIEVYKCENLRKSGIVKVYLEEEDFTADKDLEKTRSSSSRSSGSVMSRLLYLLHLSNAQIYTFIVRVS